MKDRTPKFVNIISGSLLIVLSMGLWLFTEGFPQLDEGYPGPALFPRIVAAGLGISGLVILMFGIFRKDDIERKDREKNTYQPYIRLISGLVLVGLYPLIQPLLGFIPSLSIVCLGLALLMRVQLKVAAPIAVLTSLFLYSIFYYLLGVSL